MLPRITQVVTARRQMLHKDKGKNSPRAHRQALSRFAVKFLLQPLLTLQNPISSARSWRQGSRTTAEHCRGVRGCVLRLKCITPCTPRGFKRVRHTYTLFQFIISDNHFKDPKDSFPQ